MRKDIEVLARGRFLELRREGSWEYVSRVNARGAAFVLAITLKREIILVEQRRVAMDARCIELPAGIVGDDPAHADESFAATALRELEEETGFTGDLAEPLVNGPTASGMSSEMIDLFLVRNARRVGPGGGVPGEEDIQVHILPLDEADSWLRSKIRSGVLVDPRIFAGLWFARAL